MVYLSRRLVFRCCWTGGITTMNKMIDSYHLSLSVCLMVSGSDKKLFTNTGLNYKTFGDMKDHLNYVNTVWKNCFFY